MTDRMSREELIALIDTLNIDREEFWVLSSGALTIRKIFPNAGDLDMAVTNKGLEQLKKDYTLVQKPNGWYTVSDRIECTCLGEKEDLDYQPELIDGIYVQDINEYLEYLESSTREKDKQRIGLVKEYINGRKR